MKLFIKVLLFVFVALVANVKVTGATIPFFNIQETITAFSFQNEIPKTIYKVNKNDEANCCQNEQDLVAYRNRGIGVETVAAKTVKTLQTGGNVLNKSTLKALNLTKEQGKIAIEGLKKDLGLRSDFHGKILSNGDLVNSKTNQVLGNLFDYLP